MNNWLARTRNSTYCSLFLIVLSVSLIYANFLWNPVVFDDIYFFNGSLHTEYLGKAFSLQLRWLPYATFEWTRAILGLDLIWFHLGNLAIHIGNAILLFFFLRALFQLVLSAEKSEMPIYASSTTWMACLSAVLFALHPAAVYAVTYLSQRSTLMAMFFVLVMWNLVLQGVVRGGSRYFLVSVVAYLFAALAKEHVIMAPAVVIALLVLVGRPDERLLRRALPSLVLYGLVGLFVVYQVKMKNVLGQAYEVSATDILARLSHGGMEFDPALAYPLSILTQSFLFFKYLFVWMVPSPAWMSVDMVENFATKIWSPYLLTLVCFLFYGGVAIWLLLKRRYNGLLGFAMLCPWLMFVTEFATVRIQEPFVLYRSYIWMAGAFAIVPFLVQKLPTRRSIWLLTITILLMLPLTWARLTTFKHPLLLWDDAARLLSVDDMRPGAERIYYNRGLQLFRLKMYPDALQDFNKALLVNPDSFYAYNNRGAVYLEMHKYREALDDFSRAAKLRPDQPKAYLGLVKTYQGLGNQAAAEAYRQKFCALGGSADCRVAP